MRTILPSVPEWQLRYPEVVAKTEQIIWVEASDWDQITATLSCWQKEKNGWQRAMQFPVTIGRSGMIPGNGTLTYPGENPHKQEGDGKTPVGIYPVLYTYGYARSGQSPTMGMPYLPVTKRMRCVDDPKSRHYNKLVDLDLIEKPDWDSAEEMYREDDLYKWGIVVDYNFTQVVQGAGSCVFLHLWRSPESPTAGCTAMAEENMLALLEWLRGDQQPIMIATPQVWSEAFRELVALPEVT